MQVNQNADSTFTYVFVPLSCHVHQRVGGCSFYSKEYRIYSIKRRPRINAALE